jgi:hypothetical protein
MVKEFEMRDMPIRIRNRWTVRSAVQAWEK